MPDIFESTFNRLEKHTKTKTHSDNIIKLNQSISKQSVLSNVVILTNEQKTINLKLVVCIATHSSIMSVDHLSEINWKKHTSYKLKTSQNKMFFINLNMY